MTAYAFRILNVFAETPLGGNPLAVFEDARGIDDATMQALALQFNLSETTFILPSTAASARVRIFTPTFEMPFAGHPTLGTAHVVRSLSDAGDAVTLEMRAGVIAVRANGDEWTLAAKAPQRRPVAASRQDLAAMLGLDDGDLGATPLWVDTGSEHLVIPLASPDAVRRTAPRGDLMLRHASVTLPAGGSRTMAYVWCESGKGRVLARFFFLKQGAIVEDPGTGSACANLGGWFIAQGTALPLSRTVSQGSHVGRPSKLYLDIDASGSVRVAGDIIELARGSVTL